MNEKFGIKLSKYVYFDDTGGSFYLTNEAQEMIYREKGIICSYSGSNEWINYFMCELIDLFSGSSIYNYALGTIEHKTEIPRVWKENPKSVVEWVRKSTYTDWGKAMYKTIDIIIDNLPNH